MTSEDSALPGIASILYPSDFSVASEAAFAHALKIALATRAKLTLFHASDGGAVDWHDFPGVRRMLERWQLLPQDSTRDAVADLGVGVVKRVAQGDGPVKTVRHYLAGHATDLIVLGTHAQSGRVRWLRPSVAEPIARDAHSMTLFVPYGLSGFVSKQDGSVSLASVLIAAAAQPSAQPAIDAAARLVAAIGGRAGRLQLLHVGEEGGLPALELAQVPGWTWRREFRRGPVIESILAAADDCKADLMVMTTEGHNGFLDALRGSTTERVLHRAQCPLLAIPAPAV